MHIIIRSSALSGYLGLASMLSVLAYIDPATGGMLFQVLAAVFALFSGFALVFSRQIKVILARVMRSLRGSDARDQEPASDQES